jgi:site-specific recombinase XerD
MAEIAAFRAYLQVIDPKRCVERFIPERLGRGRNARGVLGAIRRSLIASAKQRHRTDWSDRLTAITPQSPRRVYREVDTILRELPSTPIPLPQLDDSVTAWINERAANALIGSGIHTLTALAVRMHRRRMWWRLVDGLGQRSAMKIQAFFDAQPELSKQATLLLSHLDANTRSPWQVNGRSATSTNGPNSVTDVVACVDSPYSKQFDGSRGVLRAPKRGCLLNASNDYEAVNAWLDLQESAATQRAYRKEVERLMLWAIVERKKPLSSLVHEDAVAYRTFLRRPSPASRWIGPVAVRSSTEWRPFQGALSVKSAAYALTVLSSLYRWLTEQRYLVGNPFAGVNAKASKAAKGEHGTSHTFSQPRKRAFSAAEWKIIRRWADRAERDLGWGKDAAARLRFVLDFTLATGLRVDEIAQLTLREFFSEKRTQHWVTVKGKGGKRAPVAIPPLAWNALKAELKRRGIAASMQHWPQHEYVVTSVNDLDATPTIENKGLTAGRIWAILKRFFEQVAERVETKQPQLAEKLRAASPHWLRHTHATMALEGGAELIAVRDNLRHASVSTTSNYLHVDELKRARQIGKVFQ